jgi:hypothetical protein
MYIGFDVARGASGIVYRSYLGYKYRIEIRVEIPGLELTVERVVVDVYFPYD